MSVEILQVGILLGVGPCGEGFLGEPGAGLGLLWGAPAALRLSFLLLFYCYGNMALRSLVSSKPLVNLFLLCWLKRTLLTSPAGSACASDHGLFGGLSVNTPCQRSWPFFWCLLVNTLHNLHWILVFSVDAARDRSSGEERARPCSQVAVGPRGGLVTQGEGERSTRPAFVRIRAFSALNSLSPPGLTLGVKQDQQRGS